MLKNILKLDGVQKLSKEQQSKIEGGLWGTLEECLAHCPSASGYCVASASGNGYGCFFKRGYK